MTYFFALGAFILTFGALVIIPTLFLMKRQERRGR